MRLFLALRLDSRTSKMLTSVLHDLKSCGVKGNYVPAQNLHITLVFIGETDRVKEIRNVIGSVPLPPIRISPEKLSFHGDIIWAEVKSNQKLKEYVSNVREALDNAGINFDHKKFNPHITLVRKAAGNCKGVQIPKETMTADHVSLMKSTRKDGKMVYTEVAGWGR